MFETIQKIRRDLHQIPELELNLPKTKAYLSELLTDLPCSLEFPMNSAILAYFDNGCSHTVAFRSDMDALPVNEQTMADYQSRHPGCMHACGHDAHMTMLIALAYAIPKYLHELSHNILLIFQPGEENPGGARLLCEAGILEKYHVTRIYGMHVWPDLPAGVIAASKEEMMARSSEVNIEIKGKSAHAAKYREGCDALETACRYLCDLYRMEQSLPQNEHRLLRFGVLHAGTIRNVVSDHARLEGTIRACRDEVYDYMRGQLHEIAENYHRDCFAVPGRIGDTFSEGCNNLIQTNRAVLLQDAEGLVRAMNWDMPSRPAVTAVQRQLFPDLSEEEQLVVGLLQKHADGMQINALVVESNIAINRMTGILFELEMKGIVRALAGGVYRLIGI